MNTIQFVPDSPKEYALGHPQPAKTAVPEWYKKGEAYFKDANGVEHAAMKACIPFLDVMISGYMLVTPVDIKVTLEGDKQHVTWSTENEHYKDLIGERPKALGETIPRPAGHSPNGLVWSSKWGWKTPRGWSSIVTHPYNRHDLPFTTLSAFVESDKYFSNGNIPFFLREGFEGVIPAGTPFAQVIPIKRASWTHTFSYSLTKLGLYVGEKVRANDHGYKKKYWVRKIYE